MIVPGSAEARRRLPPLERRAQIVAIASKLFRERGYHEVGMREIADAAQIKSASLYHHFASKTDLLQAIVETVSQDFIRAEAPIVETSDEPDRSVTDRLAGVLKRQIVHLCTNADALWVADRELHLLPSSVIADIQRSRRSYQRLIGRLIAEGIKRGELQSRSPELVALAALDLVNGVSRWYRPRRGRSLEQLADDYVAIIVWDLLGARRSTRA